MRNRDKELRAIWDREYDDVRAIPSSTRAAPSKALQLYEPLIDFRSSTPILDVGCGNGRNSIYLAEKGCRIDAVDASPVAIEISRRRATDAGVADQINLQNVVLGEHWPFPEGYYGAALDSYVFCHVLEEADREIFRRELHRVVRVGGLVYTAAFSFEDEYYAELHALQNPASSIVTDLHNNVTKRLYTEHDFRNFFASTFRVRFQIKFQFDDVVFGRSYRRSILTLLLEK